MGSMYIPYTLKRSGRARNLRISVHPDGSVEVVAPERLSREAVLKFVESRKDWIFRHVKKANNKNVIWAEKKLINQYKKQAEVLVNEMGAHFARVYGVEYKSISVRSFRSQWGSCSKEKKISFSYQIALLPRELQELVIVHEICHLVELNHSKAFWNLVAKMVPDYLKRRKELRNIVVRFR